MKAPIQVRGDRISISQAVLFSAAWTPIAILGTAQLLYLPPHLARELGVPLAALGLALAIPLIVDVFTDPLLAMTMDRTRTRFGRYRPWMVAGLPGMALAAAMLFFAPRGIGPAYVAGWTIFLFVNGSMLGLGHTAWAANLATSYHARSKLFAVQTWVATAGFMVVVLVPVVGGAAGLTDAQNVVALGVVGVLAMPLTVAPAVLLFRERVAPDHTEVPARIGDYVALLAKPELFRLAVARVAFAVGPGCMNAMYFFFTQDYLRLSTAQASVQLVVFTVAGFAAAPAIAWLARRIGKHRALIACAMLFTAGLCMAPFVPKGQILAAAPAFFWCGFWVTGFDALVPAMMADSADEVRLEQGRERMSLILVMNTTAAKAAAALSVGITFPLLQAIGYVAKAGSSNTAEATRNLALIFVVLPGAFVLLGALCFIGWRMTPERHAAIRAELDRRDAEAERAAVAADPAVVVEPAARQA